MIEAVSNNNVMEKGKTVWKADKPYDPVKNINKKKEFLRLGVIIDDMWTVYKGENEEHMEVLVRDIKVF
jgi:hypothetical protein